MTEVSEASLTGYLRKHLRLAVFLGFLSLVPMMISCYGRFPLTRAVYRFNGEVGSGQHKDVIQSVVFWGFIILPVYEIATLGDAIIFNLIEFWTGDTLDISYEVQRSDGVKVALTPDENGKEAVLTLSRDGQIFESHRFVRVSPEIIELRDQQDRLDGKILRVDNGDLRLIDAHGSVIRTIPAAELADVL